MLRLTYLFLILFSVPSLFALPPSEPANSNSEFAELLEQAASQNLVGNFKNALDLTQKAFQLSKATGDKHAIARALVKMSHANSRLANFDAAAQLAEQAIQIYEELKDENGKVDAMASIVNIYYRTSKYTEAIRIADEAISIATQNGYKSGLAEALNYKARCTNRLGDYDTAIDLLKRSLALAEEVNDLFRIQLILGDLGSNHWLKSDLAEALVYFEKALEYATKNGDQFGVGLLRGNRGLVYWNQGDLNKALEDFEVASQVYRKSGYRSGEGSNTFNIAILQMNLGEYGKAQQSFQDALSISREINDPGLESVVLDEFGKLQRDLGNPDLALKYFEESYRISEKIGEKRASAYALVDIADIYESRGNYKEALERYEKALKLYEEMGEKKAVAGTIGEIGQVYCALGNHGLALDNHRKALALQQAIGFRLHEGRTHLDIGHELHQLGRKDEAEEELTAAIELLFKEGNDKVLAKAFHEKAQLLRDLKRNDESVQCLKEAIHLIEKIRADVLFADLKSTYFQDKLPVYEDLISALLESGNTLEAFEYAQKSKARAFLDVLAEARIHDPTMDPSLEERKKKLLLDSTAANRSLQEELYSDKPDPAKIKIYKKQIEDLDAEYSKLLIDIRNLNPRLADVQRPKILTANEAQKLLDADSVLLEYFSGPKGTILFVLTTSEVAAFTLPSSTQLANDVRNLREAIQKPDPVLEISENAHTNYAKYASLLYQALVQPASKLVKDKHRIIIAPDGPLHYLPFESLITEPATKPIVFAKLSYLAAEYELHYVPSVSVLGSVQNNLLESPAERNQFIAFADPSINSTKFAKPAVERDWSASLGPLPHSRDEVKGISSLYPPQEASVFIGVDATEKNVKSLKLDQYKYIHLASHGLIDEQNPQFSSLVFASDKDGSEDGYLTMREVFDLRLKADLVVLSACKTGLGKQIRGEGVSGLSRAFLSAGSPRVVASLWNVYDRSTADFMIAFYRNLQVSGINYSAALKKTRIHLIRSGKYSHPYYWAPFVLIGVR